METSEMQKMAIEFVLTLFSSAIGAWMVFRSAFSKAFNEQQAARVSERRFGLYDEMLAQIAKLQFHPAYILEKEYILSTLSLRARASAYASDDVRDAYNSFFLFIKDTNLKFQSYKNELWSAFFEEGKLLGTDNCGNPVFEDKPLYSGANGDYQTALASLHEECLPKATLINTHAEALANAIHQEYEKQREKK